jgi:hypothetical protein
MKELSEAAFSIFRLTCDNNGVVLAFWWMRRNNIVLEGAERAYLETLKRIVVKGLSINKVAFLSCLLYAFLQWRQVYGYKIMGSV